MVEVSAKTGQGIDELLDTVLLVADIEELKADADTPSAGLIIEAHMEQGRGPVAVALVETGTLRQGGFVVAGGAYARIRNLETTEGRPIKEAGPSTPVVITGFKSLPEFADEFRAVKDEKTARQMASTALSDRKQNSSQMGINSSELIRIIDRSNQVTELNVLIKTDVQGSLTSVIDSLKALDTEEVAVRIVGSGVGNINDNDIYLANTSKAFIYGFNVAIPTNIKQLANRDSISVRLFNIIYELIDDIRGEMSKLLAPDVVETDLGTLIVRGIFKTSKTEVICGGEVTKGKLTYPALARVVRDKDQLAEVEITNLKRGPQDTKEVFESEMCGLSFKSSSRVDIKEGDRIEAFTRETVARKL